MSTTEEPISPPSEQVAWIRDQILANARFIFPTKLVEIVTGREALNFTHKGETETQYLRYAHLVSVERPKLVEEKMAATKDDKTDETKRNGNGAAQLEAEPEIAILMYGSPIVGSPEAAMQELLGNVEDKVHTTISIIRRKMLRP